MSPTALPHRASILLAHFLLLLLFHFSANAEDGNEEFIREPVTALHNALLFNMKQGDALDFDTRYTLLKPVITERFDTALIARVVLGRYWKTLDEQAQSDFIALFNQLTVATYANRFNSYTDESFNNSTIEPMKKERYLVKTELLVTGEEPVSLDYIVQYDNDKWKIISVIANGVNDLSLKRAEYGSVIRDKGYDTLVKDITTKIEELRSP